MTNPHGHKPHIGYKWKLCPYSNTYKELFYDLGYRGSSTNPELQSESWSPFSTAAHTTTNGYMVMTYCVNKGFICKDQACLFYITNGRYYTEV